VADQRPSIGAQLRASFLTGLLVLLPVWVTGWVLVKVIGFARPKAEAYLTGNFPDYSAWPIWRQELLLLPASILAIVFVAALIVALGIFARNIAGRRLIGFAEAVLGRIPILNKVFISVKDISHAFLGRQKSSFNRVVLIEYPRPGIHTLGLVSREFTGRFFPSSGEKTLTVFVPTTPNPTSGMLVLAPESQVRYLDMTVEDALKFLISGGMLMPEDLEDVSTPEGEL